MRKPVEIRPDFAAAVTRHVEDIDRHVDEFVRCNRVGERARGAVKAAARGRAGNDFDGAFRPPRAVRFVHAESRAWVRWSARIVAYPI